MVLLFSATPVISSRWRAWNVLAVWRTYNWKSGEYPLKEESPLQESLITGWAIYKTLKRRPTSLKDRNLWRTDLMPILGWVICPCPLLAPPFVKMGVMFLWDIIMRSISMCGIVTEDTGLESERPELKSLVYYLSMVTLSRKPLYILFLLFVKLG